MRKKLFLSFLLLIFSINIIHANANDEYVLSRYSFKNLTIKKSSLQDDRAIALSYLNKLRNNTGLWSLTENSLLDLSAYNHAKYLAINNLMGHYENQSSYSNGFTGDTPTDRAHHVGYNGSVSENVSAGQKDVKSSIDNLFSAIYHRFGFLSLTIDEIGMGDYFDDNYAYKSVYVYNMGNSLIRTLCGENNFTGGSYYYNICIDPNEKISADLYDNANTTLLNNAPKYILWPYNGDNSSMPVFYEESPDPLPNCSVSGYPVSIEFNKNKINISSFTFLDFKLYDSEDNLIDSTILNETSDPNGHLSEYQFALMPLKRLNWGEQYTAEATYEEDGEQHTITWSFITKLPEYPYITVDAANASVNVQSGKEYAVYLKPFDCNDTFNSYQYSYQGGIQSLTADFIDYNTIYLKITGSINSSAEINFYKIEKDGTKVLKRTINFIISNYDNAVDTLKLKPSENISISIPSGWSIKALPVIVQNGVNVATSFNQPEISSIWKWEDSSWKIWSPDATIQSLISSYGITPISLIKSGEGFWVNAKSSISIPFQSGDEYGLDNLNVSSGWNLLGSGKALSQSDLTNKFLDINTLWQWVNNSGSWRIWSPNSNIMNLINSYGINTVTEIKKGEGFWVNK